MGTATELRAMRNYAGHRLSPWLGHLMVSRQETARPLLTPGEVMQLPSDDALVLVSGAPPIRARKVRYYADRELSRRVLTPPARSEGSGRSLAQSGAGAWPHGTASGGASSVDRATLETTWDDGGEGGPRLEPDLNMEVTAGPDRTEELADDLGLDALDDVGPGLTESLEERVRRVARQAALDPDDGIAL